ncbi:MAG: hypothetical protein ACREEK_17235, partial [Bradyrhizobium sp.]
MNAITEKVSFFGFDELVRVPSDDLDAAPPVAKETISARMRAPSSQASPSNVAVHAVTAFWA